MASPATKRSRRSADAKPTADEASLKNQIFFPGETLPYSTTSILLLLTTYTYTFRLV